MKTAVVFLRRSTNGRGWPGNLRELRNAVERAVILSPASVLELQDLGLQTKATGEFEQLPPRASQFIQWWRAG